MTCLGMKVPRIRCIALRVLQTLKGFWVFKSQPMQLCRKNKTERSSKMIDRTEKPKIPLKFAKREARYKNLATSRDFLGRHIKFCKQNTAMLIELREN